MTSLIDDDRIYALGYRLDLIKVGITISGNMTTFKMA